MPLIAPAQAVTWSSVVSKNRLAVVFIAVESRNQTTGESRRSSGTGFVISKDGYILTARHVVRSDEQMEIATLTGAIGSRAANPEALEVIAENSNFDVALLRFINTAPSRDHVTVGNPAPVEVGDRVGSMGFPAGQEFTAKRGDLSSKGGPGASWITSINLNPGDSGAPVFDPEGRAVAVVVSRLSEYERINFALPISHAADLLAIAAVKIGEPSRTAEDVLKVSYPVNETRDEHEGVFESSEVLVRTFNARDGYKIVSERLERDSDTRVSDVELERSADGSSVRLKFRLTSGPVFDRYRGWLRGRVETEQVPR